MSKCGGGGGFKGGDKAGRGGCKIVKNAVPLEQALDKVPDVFLCPQEHRMKQTNGNRREGPLTCDGPDDRCCGRDGDGIIYVGEPRWSCVECDFDICPDCVEFETGEEMTPEQQREAVRQRLREKCGRHSSGVGQRSKAVVEANAKAEEEAKAAWDEAALAAKRAEIAKRVAEAKAAQEAAKTTEATAVVAAPASPTTAESDESEAAKAARKSAAAAKKREKQKLRKQAAKAAAAGGGAGSALGEEEAEEEEEANVETTTGLPGGAGAASSPAAAPFSFSAFSAASVETPPPTTPPSKAFAFNWALSAPAADSDGNDEDEDESEDETSPAVPPKGTAADAASMLTAEGLLAPPENPLYCPFTQQIMRDPVVLADGHTYERKAVEAYLAQFDLSPRTGGPSPVMRPLLRNSPTSMPGVLIAPCHRYLATFGNLEVAPLDNISCMGTDARVARCADIAVVRLKRGLVTLEVDHGAQPVAPLRARRQARLTCIQTAHPARPLHKTSLQLQCKLISRNNTSTR